MVRVNIISSYHVNHQVVWPRVPVQTSRVENLACQQQIQRATMVYKSLHGLASEYIRSKFERLETAYNLRDSENKLNVPLPRTNYYKNSFSYLLNSVSCDLGEAKSLRQFNRLLK